MTREYTLTAKVWLWPGKAGWHFITLPQDASKDIDFYFAHLKKGWGSLPVEVTIGKTTWKTSIFPDKKSGSYLLPLKAVVRAKENVHEGNEIQFTVVINEK